MRHAGKVVLVTGAASGIGLAMCERFAAEGAFVIAADIAPSVADVAERLGARVRVARCDVSLAADVAAAVETGVSSFGGLDVVCNNAGVTLPPTPLTEVDEHDYDWIQAVNARSVFLGMKYGIPAIRKSRPLGGCVINTASTSSLRALAGRAPYGASKSAVASLTQTAAVENAAYNIRINAICPGPTRTGIFEQAVANIPGVEQMLAEQVPLRRVCEPSEIASVASFLASGDASFMTGAIVVVDGGVTAKQF
jgi:NAD(P)-dependent dehydrogenase (short-subunit alcohol dehydrogenase family)